MKTYGIRSNPTSYQMIAKRVNRLRAGAPVAFTTKEGRVLPRRNRGLLRNHGVFKGIPPTKSRYKLVVRHLK